MVGALVVGALVVGALVVDTLVVGALVVGGAVTAGVLVEVDGSGTSTRVGGVEVTTLTGSDRSDGGPASSS